MISFSFLLVIISTHIYIYTEKEKARCECYKGYAFDTCYEVFFQSKSVYTRYVRKEIFRFIIIITTIAINDLSWIEH